MTLCTRALARASRSKVIVHGERESMRCIKPLSVLCSREQLAGFTYPLALCYPYSRLRSNQGYHRLFLRLLILPERTGAEGCTVRLRNGGGMRAPRRNAPRLESVHLPRLAKSSRRTGEFTSEGETAGSRHGRLQATTHATGNNSTATGASDRWGSFERRYS